MRRNFTGRAWGEDFTQIGRNKFIATDIGIPQSLETTKRVVESHFRERHNGINPAIAAKTFHFAHGRKSAAKGVKNELAEQDFYFRTRLKGKRLIGSGKIHRTF